MKPAQVLDHQGDLLVRLRDRHVRRVWTSQMVLDHSRNGRVDENLVTANAAALLNGMTHGVEDAWAFHVNPDLSLLTEFAASQLEPLDRIDRTVLPTKCGFARFDRGLPIRDVRGREMRLNWLLWAPVVVQQTRHDSGEPQGATAVFLWNDRYDEPDEIAQKIETDDRPEVEALQRATGRWAYIGCEILYDGMRLGPAYVRPDEVKAAEVLSDGDTPWEFTSIPRLLHAFWLLLGQTVVVKSPADIDRATRKRAGRAGLPPRVTVIQLRRAESSKSDGESLVEWSHRWVVRGHWRWQVCGPDHPLAQEISPGTWRCRLWIAPYVKGPEKAPLIVSDKVYALHR